MTTHLSNKIRSNIFLDDFLKNIPIVIKTTEELMHTGLIELLSPTSFTCLINLLMYWFEDYNIAFVCGKKYGNRYRAANRIRQIHRNKMSVVEKVVVTSSGEQIIEKKRNCKRCGDNVTNDLDQTINRMSTSNRGRMGGMSLGLNNTGFLRQKGYFGNKI